MIILKKSFKYSIVPIFILSILSSCGDNSNLKKNDVNVFVRKHKLIEDVYYSIGENDSIIFYMNNLESKKFKLKLEDSVLSLDSILVYDGENFGTRAFYETKDGQRIIQIRSGFGRVNLLGFDSDGKCDMIVSRSESLFFDVCINHHKNTFFTIVSGYGSNPGPFEVFRYETRNIYKITASIKLDESEVNRFDRWRKIFDKF